MKSKGDKLASTKNSTGDLSSPPEVQRAKHAARDILGRAAAASMKDYYR